MPDKDRSDRVRSYYDARAESEWHRLENPYEGSVEQEIHRRAFEELLPAEARVLDLGGGPGRWTIWLARRGHRVVLADLSPRLLEIAGRELEAAGVEAEAVIQVDARDLGCFQDGEFDAVLALGPFYHLLAADERNAAARETRRVLRSGGLLLATVMLRYSWALGLLLEGGAERLLAASEVLEQGTYELAGAPNFTDAYLHRPAEVAPFFESVGFETLRVIASQGILDLVQERLADLRERDEAAYQGLIEIAYAAAGDPSVLGLSGHLLYAGRASDS
ncbi:MAG: methyltransferase domain-containing protein [Chloroflexota bacterium]